MVLMFASIGIVSSCAVTFVQFQSCAATDHSAVSVQNIELKLISVYLVLSTGMFWSPQKLRRNFFWRSVE